MRNFQVGQLISVTDQAIGGKIMEIKDQRAYIMLDDGFEEWISVSKIVLKQTADIDITQDEEKHRDSYIDSRPERIHEIDLHIENLVIDWKKIPSNKILDRQLTAFIEEFNYARKNQYDSMIVIHGKGAGILKSNIIHKLIQFGFSNYEEMTLGNYRNAAIQIYLSS
jgi:hypothetical protein